MSQENAIGHGSPEMFSTSLMTGDEGEEGAEQYREASKEDSEGSEESKRGLDRCSVRGD